MAKKYEIIVGTNEEFVLGYHFIANPNGSYCLEQSYTDHSHTGSVRQVAVGGRYLASGGTDEHIKLFDLEKRVEVGTLMQHEGTITHLGFHGEKFLFSAGEDGNICIFTKRKWECQKTLRNKKSPVISVSVHPSGKLALSLTKDKKLKTWNLIKGRRAYINHMDKIPDLVQWAPSGCKYIIVKGSFLDVYDIDTCKTVHSVDFKEKISTFVFLTEDIVAVAAGDKNVCFYDITNHLEILQWEAHKLRVKTLSVIPRYHIEDIWLASGSSDGIIKVWQLEMLDLTSKPKLLAEVDTTCRIICMAVHISADEDEKKIEDVIKKEELEDQTGETVKTSTKSKSLEKKKKSKSTGLSVEPKPKTLKNKKIKNTLSNETLQTENPKTKTNTNNEESGNSPVVDEEMEDITREVNKENKIDVNNEKEKTEVDNKQVESRMVEKKKKKKTKSIAISNDEVESGMSEKKKKTKSKAISNEGEEIETGMSEEKKKKKKTKSITSNDEEVESGMSEKKKKKKIKSIAISNDEENIESCMSEKKKKNKKTKSIATSNDDEVESDMSEKKKKKKKTKSTAISDNDSSITNVTKSEKTKRPLSEEGEKKSKKKKLKVME